MGEDPGRLRFSKQTFTQAIPLGFVGKIGKTNGFYGDDAANGGVLSTVDDAGRAAPELIQDSVPTDLRHAADAILTGQPIQA